MHRWVGVSFKSLIALVLVAALTLPVLSQDDAQNDEAVTAQLRREGERFETPHAILWIEKGSLTHSQAQDFALLVEKGIVSIEDVLGAPFDKAHFQADKVEYFINPNVRISHASSEGKPYIYLSSWRVRTRTAPYLHETIHVLAWWSLGSLWLQEGLANTLAKQAAQRGGGYVADPFNPENTDFNSLIQTILSQEVGQKVLPLIGYKGKALTPADEALFRAVYEDDEGVRPAFYHLSESFVSYLVEKVGLRAIRQISDFKSRREGVLQVTGRSLDAWKAEWLQSVQSA